MRAFLAACAAIIVLAIGGYFSVNSVQRLSGIAYTTEGARITPSWSWRRVFTRAGTAPATAHAGLTIPAANAGLAEECDVATTWRWIFVDFGDSAKDAPSCE
jgi:hypothetical protein